MSRGTRRSDPPTGPRRSGAGSSASAPLAALENHPSPCSLSRIGLQPTDKAFRDSFGASRCTGLNPRPYGACPGERNVSHLEIVRPNQMQYYVRERCVGRKSGGRQARPRSTRARRPDCHSERILSDNDSLSSHRESQDLPSVASHMIDPSRDMPFLMMCARRWSDRE